MRKDTFREQIWKLPAADLLGVGRATQRVLDSYYIRTIGDLANTDPEFLRQRLGKNGDALWNYANGNDLSLVAKKDFVSPIKSVGHGITTVADLEKPEQVWPVFLELTQDIGHKLRVHGLSAEGVAIHIRDNTLDTRQWQTKIALPTQSPMVIAKTAFQLFEKRYGWLHPIRSVTVQAINLIPQDTPRQIDKYFKLGKNLNQRDTIAVRRMVDGYLKLMYPNGEFSKDELEEVLRLSLEMRRRVKEQLKKLGGMEFYDVNFSYIDNETFEEKYVSVPEQGGDTLIPEGMGAPGQLYTISRGKSGMIGAFRLESQMLPGSGKFDKTGLGSDGKAKEAANTAFNFLKANARHISGNISTTAKDYIVNYQDLQGIGMTEKLALPTVIALCSIAIGRPTLSSLAVLGDISIGGTLIKVDELANTLQACADCGAKKVLLPAVSMVDFATVPADLMTAFQLIPYQNAEDAVFKALGVE